MSLNSNINNDSLVNSSRTDETSFSYSNRSNASLQILKTDFMAFTFFLREKELKASALNISKTYNPLDRKNIESQLVENDSSKDVDHNTHKFDSKNVKKLLLDNLNTSVLHLNSGNFNKHTFLEFFRNSNMLDKVGNDFNTLFSEFEAYVIKLFSVHPTLGSTGRGIYIDDDGSMVYTLLDYIRSYESSMYLLSQKQHYYFYVSLFLLIVLLRNFRRFLHHYKSSNTLSDLMLMMAEAISMCQNHIYKSFVTSKKKINKKYPNKYTDVLLSGQFYSDPELEYERDLKTYLKSLKTHNNNCLKIKEDIFRLCKDEFKNPQSSTCVDDSVMNFDTTYASEDEIMSEDTEFTHFYDNISTMSTWREGFLDSTLDYDKSEITYLSDFNLILDDKICWWISELCSLCNLYCKLGHSPTLMVKRYTKLVLCSNTTVLPKLSNSSFTNLDVHRSLLVRKSIRPTNKKMKELKFEAKARGYTKSFLSKTDVVELNFGQAAKLLFDFNKEINKDDDTTNIDVNNTNNNNNQEKEIQENKLKEQSEKEFLEELKKQKEFEDLKQKLKERELERQRQVELKAFELLEKEKKLERRRQLVEEGRRLKEQLEKEKEREEEERRKKEEEERKKQEEHEKEQEFKKQKEKQQYEKDMEEKLKNLEEQKQKENYKTYVENNGMELDNNEVNQIKEDVTNTPNIVEVQENNKEETPNENDKDYNKQNNKKDNNDNENEGSLKDYDNNNKEINKDNDTNNKEMELDKVDVGDNINSNNVDIFNKKDNDVKEVNQFENEDKKEITNNDNKIQEQNNTYTKEQENKIQEQNNTYTKEQENKESTTKELIDNKINNKQTLSSQDKETTVPKPKGKRSEYNKWTDDETNLFLDAINLHGIGHWSYISKMFFNGKRSQMQLKDKWVNLQRYKKVKQVQPEQNKVENLVTWVLVTSEGSE